MNDNYYTKELCRGFGLDYEEVIKINNSNPPRAYKFIGEGLLWYSRRDLALILLRYSIHVTELWSAVSQGDLTAYDEKGLTIINSFNVMGQNPPGCKYEQITIDNVWYFFYKGEDIKKFVENLRPSANQDVVAPDQQAPAKLLPAATANFFTREGTIWHIGFEGKEIRIKHLAGLQYIGYLLDKPGKPISCRELYQAVSGKTPANVMSEGAAICEGLNIGSRKQAASDYKAKQNYLEQYQRLANDLDNVEDNPEGEIVRKEYEKEMEALIPFLKERTFTDKDTARFQSNVQRRLDKAYAAIHKAGMKEMEKHLQDHIKTDRAYGLTYTGAVAWEITL